METLPSSVSNHSETYSVTPYTKLTVDIYAIRRNISTSYIATYKEQKTGKALEVEGKWKGLQIDGFHTYGRWEDIK